MNWSTIHYKCTDHALDHLLMLGAAFQLIKRFNEALEACVLWYQCESIVKWILDISSYHIFQQPVQSVFNWTQKQLMRFIRLPNSIDIAERVFPELVSDWMNTKTVHNIEIWFFPELRVNKMISWVIESSKCWMHQWHALQFHTLGTSHMRLVQQ